MSLIAIDQPNTPVYPPLRIRRDAPWTGRTTGFWYAANGMPASLAGNIAPGYAGLSLIPVNNPGIRREKQRCWTFLISSQQSLANASNSPFLDPKGEMTVSALFRPGGDYTSIQTIAAASTAAGSVGFDFEYGRTDNKFSWLHGGSVAGTWAYTFSDDQWRRVTVVRTGSTGAWTLRLVVDFYSEAITATADPTASACGFAIGRAGSFAGNYMTGAVAQVRLWTRALPLAAVLDYHNDPDWEFREPTFISLPSVATTMRRLTLLGVGA